MKSQLFARGVGTLYEVDPFSVTSEPVWCDPDNPVEVIWSVYANPGSIVLDRGGILSHRTFLDTAIILIPSFRSDGVEASLAYACLATTDLQLAVGAGECDASTAWAGLDWSVSARGLVGTVPINSDSDPGTVLRCFLRGSPVRVEVRVVLLGQHRRPVQ